MVHLRLLPLMRGSALSLLLVIVVGLALSAVAVVQAFATAGIFSGILDGTSIGDLTPWLIGLIGALLLRPILVFCRELAVHLVATRVKSDVRGRLLDTLATTGPIGLARERSGHQQSLLVDGVENLEPYFGRYIPQVLITAVTSMAVVLALISIDPMVGIAVGVTAVLVPLAPRLWDRVLAERGDSHWGAYQDLNADVVDSLRGMTTLKAFNAVAGRRKRIADSSNTLLAATLHQLRVSLVESGLTGFFLIAGPAIALSVGVIRVGDGAIDPSQVFLVTLLAFEVFRPFRDLANHWHAGYSGVSAGTRIAKLLATIRPLDTPAPADAQRRRLPIGGLSITAEHLSFTYPGADAPALIEVSFTVPIGATVALVGPSGSGKSTLASLLLRFALPTGGELQLGGIPTAHLDQNACAQAVALVSQDPVLFTGTIRDNLLLVAPDATEQELWTAVDVAGATDIVTSERGELDTVIGDAGALLSGGQRQRIAIARAVLKDSPVLVLDEASSALDARREASVFGSLAARRTTTDGTPVTTILIAHRLAAVRHVDSIVVLEGGRVVETGSFDELIARDGLFRRLDAAQRTEAPA